MKTLKETNCHITLADKGFTRYKIVIARNASLSIIHAAEELRGFLNRISGASFQIVYDNVIQTEYEIIIGDNSHIRTLNLNIDFENLGTDGFTLLTAGKTLVIAGSEKRGCLYGVYTFLEDYLGCRFFTEDVIVIPQRNAISLPEINDTQIPVLEYRESYFKDYWDGDFYARLKCNGNAGRLTEMHGFKMEYCHFVHSFNALVPPDKYFDSHPEYFSEVNGIRIKDRTQLCLTNPDVLEIAKNTVRKWILNNPNAAIISVSQNDWHNYCTCEKCRSVDEYEGSHAGTLIRFVNSIAESIEDEFPAIAIDTLAYQYTRKPPKHIRPNKNVIIRLCSIECCFSHPLADCDSDFKADLIGWSKICERLHVWDYVVNFAHTLSPFPNFHVLQPNIKFFIEHNVTGIFEEGNNSDRESGEFNALKQYIIAKLLWNPDYDVDAGIAEFMTAYYGMAAYEIKRYFDLIHDMISPDIHMRIYDSPHTAYLSKDMLDKADIIFDRAERLAENETILARVQKLRLSVRYVRIVNIPMDETNRSAIVEEFIEDVRNSGVTSYREGGKLEHTEPLLRD
jgi:hypothetical protein